MCSQKDIKTESRTFASRSFFSIRLAAVIVSIRINLNQLLVFRNVKRLLFSVTVQVKQCINKGQ